MEKRNDESTRVLFFILLGLFLYGMAAEIVLKLVNAAMAMPSPEPRIFLNQILQEFGNEAVPLFAFPALGLNLIPIMPHNNWAYALRWLPFLVLFFLPALCAVPRLKTTPLIVCAAVYGVTAAGLLLTQILRPNRMFSVWSAIPYAAETAVLILACVALGLKNKGFAISVGVISLLFAAVSPVVSSFISGIDTIPQGIPFSTYLTIRLKTFPLSAAVSHWPILKTFAFIMYALILFVLPVRFSKKEDPYLRKQPYIQARSLQQPPFPGGR